MFIVEATVKKLSRRNRIRATGLTTNMAQPMKNRTPKVHLKESFIQGVIQLGSNIRRDLL